MPKLPEPPAPESLATIPPDEKTLSQTTLLWRIYFHAGPYGTQWNTFRAFGPTNARFDHHLPPPRLQERKILYAAAEPTTCFAEVFQDTRVIDRTRNEPVLVAFELVSALTLLDLAAPWPTQAGGSMAINSGDRPLARQWSQLIYLAYPRAAGLWYCSSMDANRGAVALYEGAQHAMPERPAFHRALSDRAIEPVVIAAAQRFNYRMV